MTRCNSMMHPLAQAITKHIALGPKTKSELEVLVQISTKNEQIKNGKKTMRHKQCNECLQSGKTDRH